MNKQQYIHTSVSMLGLANDPAIANEIYINFERRERVALPYLFRYVETRIPTTPLRFSPQCHSLTLSLCTFGCTVF